MTKKNIKSNVQQKLEQDQLPSQHQHNELQTVSLLDQSVTIAWHPDLQQ